ncbi:MAG: hypothetical protein UR96_C0007G0001 [candidate division WS6 bacterium GW2011_GWC1_36_11]|uniref:Uncharacterized protein n=1 Tax=candidate division WS6 bacterium GW2011_GWC1_36_11 TaxID=1619090 RepID=A0A0G0GM42_9BACT|nr:MAG: hypothetical protein UR96_C0007G0001 [candidate division WS6 bacterium GW2011_GWC1_36_11]KKQ02740.1 MAG: hypothetical protein US14_C0045G0005 [candidate division WS6 bacterium GW2011_WS6_36_26]HAM37559.1 hypothetical protein [Patescibacteria group bacterium]HAM96528.1 hypothetical protein [Patescibacteria group bacterium]
MKKSIFAVVVIVLVLGAMLSACNPPASSVNNHVVLSQPQAEKISNVANQLPERGSQVNSSVQAAADPTPTPIPTAQTRFDEQFAMLDAAIVIPVGDRDVTVKYLSPLSGKMYFIQKYYFTSGGVGFAFYRSEKVWVKAPVGTVNAQSTPVASMEVVVPVGGDIGMSQFFWEAVPTNWAIASDFTTSITLENNPWYK